MAILVIGGSGRGAGKTALVCGLLAALPERDWIAVKIAGHAHGVAQPVWEETAAGRGTDTARFLAAGARRAFLLTAVDDAGMQSALVGLSERVEPGANLIFESNRVLDFVKADVCLMVVGGVESKSSSIAAIRRADAIVVGDEGDGLRDAGGPLPIEAQPVFRLEQFELPSPALAKWIRSRLIYR